MTQLVVGNLGNLLLTKFRQFWQLVGRFCVNLLPRQDGRTSHIKVNGRFFYLCEWSPCNGECNSYLPLGGCRTILLMLNDAEDDLSPMEDRLLEAAEAVMGL